jgi:hypothetical protein
MGEWSLQPQMCEQLLEVDMPAPKTKTSPARNPVAGTEYHGKMTSFLAFLAQDIAHAPQYVQPLDSKLAKRMDRLTKDVHVSPDEDLGDEAS